ncbi:MAG: hypothetical protein GXO32_01175 [Crenarchaeota archaeon]|nr:hypothetical protein [Thermoproteota archaeon]
MPAQQKSKELKTFSMQVITLDDIKRDERKMRLLQIIESAGPISEKALTHLLYLLKEEKGIDLGYNFVVIGGKPVSKEVLEDLRALLYVGLIENEPRTRKLQVTSNGLEFLEKNRLGDELTKKVLEAVEELKPKIAPIDAEVELAVGRGGRKGRR